MSKSAKRKLPIGSIVSDVFRVYGRHWKLLVPAAVVILIPQALVDGVLGGLNIEGLHSAADVATLAAVPLTIAVSLLGQALYAGFAAAAVVEWRAGQPLPGVRQLVSALPIGRLIVVDLVLGVGTAIGFLLLIIPGVIFLAYFSIAPALIKIEHQTVLGSLKRCIHLVRGQFIRVLLLVAGVVVVTEILVGYLTAPFHAVAASVVADLAVEGILEPFEGLVIVLTALALLDLRGEAPSRDELEIAPAAPHRSAA